VHAGPDGVRLRFVAGPVAIEYHHPGAVAVADFALPLDALIEFDSRKGEVTLCPRDNGVELSWSKVGALQTRHYRCDEVVPDFPAWPSTETSNGPDLLAALDCASQTAAKEAVRYALNRICQRALKTGHRGALQNRPL
jgi:hypothetical protein